VETLSQIIEQEFRVIDKASKPLEKMASSVGKVDGLISKMGSAVLGLGGLGGILKINEAVGQVNETYKAVGRIKSLTGATAEEAHSLLDAFELAGVENAETIIAKMTKKAQMLEGGLGGGAKQVEHMTGMYRKLGIAIDAGPKETLLGMATAAQKGQVNFAQMSRMLGVSGQQAASMWEMLQRGPEAIKNDIDESLKGSDLITEGALKQHKAWGRAKREMADTFEGVVGTVYKSLLPGLTKMVTMVKEGIAKWEAPAKRFADYLSKHMDKIFWTVKAFLKVLAAQKVMGFLGMGGIGATASRLVGFAMQKGGRGVGGGLAALVPGLGPIVSIFRGASKFAGASGGFMNVLGGLGKFLPMLGKLSIIGVIIAAVVKAFSEIWSRSQAVRDAFGKIWTTIKNVVGILADTVGKALAVAWDGLSAIVDLLAKVLTPVIELIAKAIGELVGYLGKLLGWLDKLGALKGSFGIISDIASEIQKPESMLAAVLGTAPRGGAGGKPPEPKVPEKPQFDFRGSKFDITQEFAEGFDPDRIAVVFANDLAKLGERRLQSGLAPIYAVR
jgi:hypothetical protein